MYEKQTKHKTNTRAKNHSYGGLGLEEGFRYIGKTFKASADPQARRPERERERRKSDYHVWKTVSWCGAADSL